MLIVFFFFSSFFPSACEFWFIERIGAHGEQNPGFILLLFIISILNFQPVPSQESQEGLLSVNSLSFPLMRFNTFQYSRCFVSATTRLWHDLLSMIVEAVELQQFKLGADAFLFGVVGPSSIFYPSGFEYFCMVLAFSILLNSLLLLFGLLLFLFLYI